MSHVEGPHAFGPLLRHHRIAAALTQEALAERTGVRVRSIQHLEGGAHLPQRETVQRLLRVLGLSGEDRSQFERVSQPPPRHPAGRTDAIRTVPFGDLLRRYRRAAGLTQEVLAERAHVSLRAISDIERGARNHPWRDTVRFLADALGLEPAERNRLEIAARRVGPPSDEPLTSTRPLEASAARSNLPIPLTSFIGRAREMAEVKERLDSTRLLTLTGTGGCGKTRMALQIATDLGDTYPDGVWLVELAPLSDPWLVPSVVAAVLGVRAGPGQPMQTALITTLRTRRLLLLLDNCEHLLDACAHLTDAILRQSPGVRILATSREALGIAGEGRWRVPSLALPSVDPPASLAALAESEAIRLFVERAGAVQPDFVLTEQNASSVAQICRRLDGIPLAIELAATRVTTLSPAQIAVRLDERFRLLTTGSRTVLPRHQTLAALVGWSYNLLTEPERALFNQLSVFAGGFRLEAAEAVCEDVGDVLDLLSNLVSKSLVVADSGAGGVERYHLLETLRRFGAEKLDMADASSSLRARHLAWCVDLAERAELNLIGPEQVQWLEQLAQEHDNLRAALSWSREHNPEAGLRLASSIWIFWQVRGYAVEGGEHLAALLDRARDPTVARAKALLGAAILAIHQTDRARQRARLEESLALSRQFGDKRGIAWALENIGTLASDSGDTVTARVCLEEALALAQEVGETWRMGWVAQSLAGTAQAEGDLPRARVWQEESLALYRKVGEKRGLGGALTHLGNLALLSEDYRGSQARFAEALAVYRDIGDQRGIGRALRGLGNVHHLQDKRHLAATHYEESLSILRKVGAERNVAETLLWLGILATGEGDIRRARAYCCEGLEIFRAAGEDQAVSLYLRLLAMIAMHEAAYVRAVRLTAAVPTVERDRRETLILVHRTGVDVELAQARSALGEEGYAAAQAEGQAMTLEQAIAYALEANDT